SANVSVIHVFCYAYLQLKSAPGERIWLIAEGLVQVIEEIFSAFIQALPLACVRPERILSGQELRRANRQGTAP
ncbi:hypothetical protein MMC14_007418, partial [Varicellaria rhodocarpa]|nr:hypothetical protein [Varicellaria rhodocarpa]